MKRKTKPEPILMVCEGSNQPGHLMFDGAFALCAMCGRAVSCKDDGTVHHHHRQDILAMIDRGAQEDRQARRAQDGLARLGPHGTQGAAVSRKTTPEPILMVCEGSGQPGHGADNSGITICKMCGFAVWRDDSGNATPHHRQDILAMIDRGDFR